MASVPDFYEPQRVGTLYYPEADAIAASARDASLAPATSDRKNVQLLLIDMQIDFCHPQGTLYVPGAEDDIRRLATFIFRHAERITDITCTLDSHLPFQIFHAAWWVDEQGRHPEPLTIISYEDVRAGRWRPLVMPEHSESYVQQLEEKAKKQLTIWPYHVLMGGIGNALDPSLWSVIMWHSLARKTQPTWMPKGRVPHSEHYSAIEPEIDIPGHPQGQKHRALLRTIRETDALFIAGEAQSHCVLETLEDIVSEFADEPHTLNKIYVLKDCMSPVVHPEVDFGAIAERRFADFAEMGVHFVASSDDLPALSAAVRDRSPMADEGTPISGLHRMAEWERENMSSVGNS